jgi:hypothetical protein
MKILKKIRIKINNIETAAELYDTPTGNAIADKIPFNAKINTWGKEIYFTVPVICDLEKSSRSTLEVGELGYYPPMQAFCIFFGPTPMSSNGKPQAADNVNVFGRIIGSAEEFNRLKTGEIVNVTEI